MSKKLDLSFMMSYIASWGERFEKSIMINLLRQVNENDRLELCQMHYLWQSKVEEVHWYTFVKEYGRYSKLYELLWN